MGCAIGYVRLSLFLDRSDNHALAFGAGGIEYQKGKTAVAGYQTQRRRIRWSGGRIIGRGYIIRWPDHPITRLTRLFRSIRHLRIPRSEPSTNLTSRSTS